MSSLISTSEATAYYEKALHKGKKEGGSLQVLDHILAEKHIKAASEMPLGVMSIPATQIAGTKNEGRSSSFSKSFYPLLDKNTEFAFKWINLVQAHLTEGIHDPVKVYEFMNKYYVLEGNKRVSVLRFFDAVTIAADVIRIVPPQSDDQETRLYYEYMDFFNLSHVNFVYFTKLGSFSKLQRLMNKRPDEEWSADDRTDFSSVFNRFSTTYEKYVRKGTMEEISDAFLYFVTLYGYDTLMNYSISELKEKIQMAEDELEVLPQSKVELKLDPADNKKTLIKAILPKTGERLKVAFVYDQSSETSGWTHAHELGATSVEEIMADTVEVKHYFNLQQVPAEDCLDEAIENGAEVIFTTTPSLLKATLKAAIEHPEIKFLNCSLLVDHKNVRTYYARIHEVKFLLGAIAGAMSQSGKIGYIADYPIYGAIASLNAFALGAKMINPRAQIYLQWSKLQNSDPDKYFEENGVTIICGRDNVPAGNYDSNYDRHFGLYQVNKNNIWNMAMPIWNWSVFYQRIVEQILNGNWKKDERKATESINYWWGMSAGIVDVITTHRLPIGTLRLIDLLKDTICSGQFKVFNGEIYTKDGRVMNTPDRLLSLDELIKMDWLVENIIGEIPPISEFIDYARYLAATQGLTEEDKIL